MGYLDPCGCDTEFCVHYPAPSLDFLRFDLFVHPETHKDIAAMVDEPQEATGGPGSDPSRQTGRTTRAVLAARSEAAEGGKVAYVVAYDHLRGYTFDLVVSLKRGAMDDTSLWAEALHRIQDASRVRYRFEMYGGGSLEIVSSESMRRQPSWSGLSVHVDHYAPELGD